MTQINVNSKKLKCFYFNFINNSVSTPTNELSMTTMTSYNKEEQGLPSPCGGISRMEDAEPMTMTMQFDCGGGSTPRPGGNAITNEQADEALSAEIQKIKEWRERFSLAAKESASRMKARRSINSRTVYRPMTHHLCKKGMTNLEKRIEQPDTVPSFHAESITPVEFALFKKILTKYSVRLNVADVLKLEDLKCLLEEVKRNEEKAQAATIAAFAAAMKKATEKVAAEAQAAQAAPAPASSTAAAVAMDENRARTSAEMMARVDPDYLNKLREYHDIKAWKDSLSTEITRCSKIQFKQLAHPIAPYQHARISAASKSILANILSPETCNRTFISLNELTSTIGKEFAAFLTEPTRRNDRKLVAQQIAESIAKLAKK
jgi:hypothetical protein